MKKLKVGGPETPEAVEAAYHSRMEKRDRERLQAIRLGQRGEYPLQERGDIVGHGRATLARWGKAYRVGGISGLLTRRYPGSLGRGSESMLEALSKGGYEGRWKSAGELQRGLKEQGIGLSRSGGHYWLSKVRASWKVPRKSHVKKAPDAEEAFKDTFVSKLESLPLPAEGKGRIWVLDPPRSGLISFLRRCWTLRGHRPKAAYPPKDEWGDVSAAADGVPGDLEVLYPPTVSLAWTHLFLQEVKAPAPDASHVVLLDQAGDPPKEGDGSVPEGSSLVPFPLSCPEIPPREGLWAPIKSRGAKVAWDPLEKVEAALPEVLKPFWEQGNRVRALVGVEWLTQGVTSFLTSRNSIILT